MSQCMEEERLVWYVMRFLYNRKSDTRDRLDKASVETFVPMRCEIKYVRLKIEMVRKYALTFL